MPSTTRSPARPCQTVDDDIDNLCAFLEEAHSDGSDSRPGLDIRVDALTMRVSTRTGDRCRSCAPPCHASHYAETGRSTAAAWTGADALHRGVEPCFWPRTGGLATNPEYSP